jgi:hypothetical protein
MGTTTNRALPYPEPSDLVTNGAQAIEDLANALDTDKGAVGFAATMLSNQNIPNAAWTDLTNWTETEDTHGALAAGVFTAPQRGVYLFAAGIFWGANTTGARYLSLWRQPSGGSYVEVPGNSCVASASLDSPRQSATAILEMGVGDKIVPRAFQSSGASVPAAYASSNLMTWGGTLLFRTAS